MEEVIYDKRVFMGLLMLGLLLAAEPVMAQDWVRNIGPNLPTSMECDSKDRNFGSGPTLVQTSSEVCAVDLANDIGQGTGESDITYCPGGWNDLKHSVDIILDQSGFIQVCTAFKEQVVSGTPAVASCTGPHSINISFLSAQGDHVYQVTTEVPSDNRLVETDAFLELGM